MSLVKIEPLIANNVANFTFGGLTITANAVFGNANLGNLASANHVVVTSNITAGNIGNTATYFYGNGYNLTGIVATTAASLVSGNIGISPLKKWHIWAIMNIAGLKMSRTHCMV